MEKVKQPQIPQIRADGSLGISVICVICGEASA